MTDLTKHVLFQFNRRSGKIKATITGKSAPMLKLYALQNTTKANDSIVINCKTGDVVFYFEGNTLAVVKNNMGKCTDYGIPFEAVQAYL